MKKRLLTFCLMLLMVFTCACATEPSSDKEPTNVSPDVSDKIEEPVEDTYRVALLLPGLISDAGWNAGGYYAVEYLNENVENVEATFIESISTTIAETTIRDYADRGYDMIVGYSFDFGDYLMKVAPDYPDTQFVWSQGYMQLDNMSTMAPQLQETAYLCGMIAAGMTKTGVIGFIGGMDTMPMIAALEGYKEGAKAYNPDVKVIYAFAGTWSDTELGRQTAIAMFEQGVDVLMGRGDGIALGCFQACIEKNVYCFGDVSDQNELAPELLLTSTCNNIGRTLELMIEDIRSGGGAVVGKNYSFGMPEGVADISDFHGLVPDDIASIVYETRDKIISGELVIEQKTEISQ